MHLAEFIATTLIPTPLEVHSRDARYRCMFTSIDLSDLYNFISFEIQTWDHCAPPIFFHQETTKDNSLIPGFRTTSVVKKWSIWTNMENILIGIEIVYGVYKSHFGRFWRQVILGLEIRFITSGVTGRPDDNF